MNKNTLNIIYSSDDNYAQHMGTSIYSLLANNNTFEQIRLFIIENKISQNNKENLESVINGFNNSSITWISFDEYIDKLDLNMSWPISISAYARLFVSSMLPKDVERVLYLDCDMIINNSLNELWESDLCGNVIGVVQDPVNDKTKTAVGVEPEEKYFNSGMLLIDMNLWRQQNVEDEIKTYIAKKSGKIIHHDQGVLNGVLKEKVFYLPLKYNVMTIQYFLKRDKWLKLFENHADYYSEEEYNNAKESPVIIHYTPSFTNRPWIEHCKHPLRHLYWDNLKMTPWKGAKPNKDNTKWYLRLINWRYRNFYF